jgi:hypothetical protein
MSCIENTQIVTRKAHRIVAGHLPMIGQEVFLTLQIICEVSKSSSTRFECFTLKYDRCVFQMRYWQMFEMYKMS